MNKNERLDGHQKFKELSALAQGGMLNSGEREELDRHLQVCASCRELFDEYALISSEGLPQLGALYSQPPDYDWDDRMARAQLLARVRESEKPGLKLVNPRLPVPVHGSGGRGFAKSRAAIAGMAACLLIGVAAGAYRLGSRGPKLAQSGSTVAVPSPASPQLQELTSQKKATQELLDAQSQQIARLENRISGEEQDLVRFRAAARVADEGLSALSVANNKNHEQLHQISDQRDHLAGQLRDVEQAYQTVQLELTTLRADHDRVLLRATSLESKIEELTAANHEQQRKLQDSDQYLASDRDIRELMGARKLYIADVFDVDSRSRTRKPFGRVFYTQNKSLIFYAFDLDREPGLKNASTFQVWGQRDNEPSEKAHPTNLGILYMDSELNRRWVLRFDDPKQLAEIDAVFVTIEPHGGSQKPTGKPLLYALLRKEANHP